MSGHSKWANIKRKKEANDAVRSRIFSRLTRNITLAVIEGGGITDPDNNVRLRLTIDQAKQLNMPKDNIKRAIDHAVGAGKMLKEAIYEGFAPYGVALIIVTTTDNANRTSGEIRNTLEKSGGKLGGLHAVSHLFKKCGSIQIDAGKASEEQIFAISDRLNAFDIEKDETGYTLYFPFENLGKVSSAVWGIETQAAAIIYKPNVLVDVLNVDEETKVLDLVEALENLDDVQNVFFNMQIRFR